MALELEEKYLYNSIRSTVPSDETREPLLTSLGWLEASETCMCVYQSLGRRNGNCGM